MTNTILKEEIKPTIAPKHARVGGTCVDYLIYCIIVITIFGGWTRPDEGIGIGFELTNPNFWVSIIIWLLMFVLPEGLKGQTIGKRLFRIKVLSDNYSRATFVQCIVRHLFDIIDFLPLFGILGIIVSSSTRQNKRIGDVIAKTIVVDSLRTTSVLQYGG